jgi:NAD(P)-dependent dehydrogenase (short-subunit alcohol dehydrogenase family)
MYLNSIPRPASAAVIGASGGIGSAIVKLLSGGNFDVVHAFSRSGNSLVLPNVRSAKLDLEDEASIAAAAATIGNGAPLRVIFVATGLLHDDMLEPEKTFRSLNGEKLARSFRINAVGPALIAKHMLPMLPRSGRSVFAALSARVGSIEDNRSGGWYGYRASKAALNQLIRTLAIELQRQKPDAICVALHPGTVKTALSAPFQASVAPGNLFDAAFAAERLLAVTDALSASETGRLYAWDAQSIPF